MGLFSKKVTSPVLHPPVERVVYVRAEQAAVTAHLAAYSSLFSPKRADEHELRLAVSGEWMALRLPDAVHPWQLHNLAYWMLDCRGASAEARVEMIAVSAAAGTHPGYWLVADSELPDALCGWDDTGHGWTVHVPANDIVRPEDVPTARAISIPGGFDEWRTIAVLLEDPGADMNPANERTVAGRKQLNDRHDSFVF